MPTLNSQDLELEKYFTDVEVLRDWFDKTIVAETLPKRLLVIHGVGGIGKSSLLRMFRLNCKTAHVPVALTSGDEAKSAVDVLTRWGEDLKADGVNLPTFFKTYDHYRAIQAKVEDETSKAQKKLGDIAGKATSKTAEAAGGAALGAALGSVIPGIGTAAGAALGGVVGGMGAEALVDYLRGFLSKPDIDLLLDPSKKLTDDFIADVNQAASKQRVVLMLDTYEQMTALDDWTREVAAQLNENILLVIAGRAMVNWGRQWSSWLMHAEVQELKPMPKRVMHELIRKYYATMRGGEPNPKQVNAIIEFSGGLPMVVNTAVQLWVKYGVEDFGTVKGEVVREVVARLREGVPAELYPLLETAAALRYFNKEILRAVSGMGDINASYEELVRFPFVRRRAEGYALHDRVREMIEENVQTDDPAKYRAVHERAAVYFESRMGNATGEESERLWLERLYHRVCEDEELGITLFLRAAEQCIRFWSRDRLQIILNDVNTHELLLEDSLLWVEYYETQLQVLNSQLSIEKARWIYEEISENVHASLKLRAYALCALGAIIRLPQYSSEPVGFQRAVDVLKKSLEIAPEIDSRLVPAYVYLHDLYLHKGELERALDFLQMKLSTYENQNDLHGVVHTLAEIKNIYVIIGDWKTSNEFTNAILLQLEKLKIDPIQKLLVYDPKPAVLGGVYNLIWSGCYIEAEKQLLYNIFRFREDKRASGRGYALKDLALVFGYQGRFSEAAKYFEEARGLLQAGDALWSWPTGQAALIGFEGLVSVQQGELPRGIFKLEQSLEIKKSIEDQIGVPELLLWLGNSLESQKSLINSSDNDLVEGNAESFYEHCIALRWTGRRYFECGALTGLVRVKHTQQHYSAIPPLLTEAEQLAQQYEYNDHLASLRLTQGHIAWDGHIPEWGKGFDAAFEFYKLALVYALRYNRFLLDEVLSGRPQGTPLRPIIPECLKRDEEGRKMLLALREWWRTGTNDVGTSRPDSISPIPENIALVDAEKIAREREPGDGTKQRWVVEQFEGAL